MPIVRDKSQPLELSRAEVMSLVFERILNIQNCVEECEAGLDLGRADERVDHIRHELRRMRADATRAIELVESVLEADAPKGTPDADPNRT